MEQTKYKNLGLSDQQLRLPQPPLFWQHADVDKTEIIDLPRPDGLLLEKIDIRELINRRLSHREFSAQSLSLEELSYLLWCSQGVKSVHNQRMTLRTVPSAGARHAFETVLLVNRVEGLLPGIYRYLALEHQLEVISTQTDLAELCVAACHGQQFVKDCAAVFFWIADIYRMTWRYNERGYRYLHLDAGHVCQNLYLAAEAIGVGACAVAAFDDDYLNSLFTLDPDKAFVIYLAATGKKLVGGTGSS